MKGSAAAASSATRREPSSICGEGIRRGRDSVVREEWAGVGLVLVVLADGEGGFAAVGGDPALDQPERVGEAFGESGGGFEDAGGGFLRGGEFAQDGVDHAGGVRMAGGAAELDAFVEDGVGGDAVHVQELEGAEAESEGDRLGEALVGTGEEFGEAGVERDLPAEDAHDQRGGEVAVFRSEGRGARGVEKFVAVAFVGGDEGEDFEGGGAGGGDLGEGFGGRGGGAGGFGAGAGLLAEL